MKLNCPLLFPRTVLVVCVVLLSAGGAAFSQDNGGISSRDALGKITARYGDNSVEWIVELRGRRGIPQPKRWELLAFDKKAPRLLTWFGVDERTAIDEGLDNELYPKSQPPGYLHSKDVRVDSRAAFAIAEGEARKARMGFDELNYTLRVREFSREPIWLVELIDAKRLPVGKIYLSGTDGEVLRTIWIYRGEQARADGRPLIIDSAAPRTGEQRIQSNRNETSSREIAGPEKKPMEKLDQVPISTEKPKPHDVKAIERQSSREIMPNDPKPAPGTNATNHLRDMRKPAEKPKDEPDPFFKKPKSGTPDTRIPPPPIPPR